MILGRKTAPRTASDDASPPEFLSGDLPTDLSRPVHRVASGGQLNDMEVDLTPHRVAKHEVLIAGIVRFNISESALPWGYD